MPPALTAQITRIDSHGADSRVIACQTDRDLGFRGGQYVLVDTGQTNDAGRPIRRAYSIISSDTDQRHIELAVKQIGAGVGSTYLHQRSVGDTLTLQGPVGKWHAGALAPDGPVLVIATDTGVSAALGLLRSRDLAGVLGQTCLLWLAAGKTYFLPPDYVRDALPTVQTVRFRELPAPGRSFRDEDAMRALYQVPHLASYRTAFLAGDGELCYQLVDSLQGVGNGLSPDRIRVETFFTSPAPVS